MSTHNHYNRVRLFSVIIMLLLTALCALMPSHALAEGDGGVDVFEGDASVLYDTPEKVQALYYAKSPTAARYANADFHAPLEDFVISLGKDIRFMGSVATWKTLNLVFNPSELAEALTGTNPITHEAFNEEEFNQIKTVDPLGEVGYYESMLLDVVTDNLNNKKCMDAINAIKKEYKIDIATKIYKNLKDIDKAAVKYLEEVPSDIEYLVDKSIFDYICEDLKNQIPTTKYAVFKKKSI